ncbi:MAG: peptide chain release factor-like protein [Planctomycetota bacterium]
MLTGRELISPIFVPSPHPASLEDEALLAVCTLSRNRGTGPGGQHRNKVETHVTVTHDETGISGQAGERRSPEVNKRSAVRRLRSALAVACRSPVPIGEIGSDMWRSRVKSGRISLSDRHRDGPAMLAEALDVVYAGGLDLRRAGLRLGCSTSQLTKLIAREPAALAALNAARQAKGGRPLRIS